MALKFASADDRHHSSQTMGSTALAGINTAPVAHNANEVMQKG